MQQIKLFLSITVPACLRLHVSYLPTFNSCFNKLFQLISHILLACSHRKCISAGHEQRVESSHCFKVCSMHLVLEFRVPCCGICVN